MIDFTKPVRTRGGRQVEILRTDLAAPNYRVVGILTDSTGMQSAETWALDGRYDVHAGFSDLDLINDVFTEAQGAAVALLKLAVKAAGESGLLESSSAQAVWRQRDCYQANIRGFVLGVEGMPATQFPDNAVTNAERYVVQGMQERGFYIPFWNPDEVGDADVGRLDDMVVPHVNRLIEELRGDGDDN